MARAFRRFVVWGLILLAVGSWGVQAYITRQIYLKSERNSAALGTAGDSFAIASSLVNSIAFCGLVYSILKQTEEFEQNREANKRQDAEQERLATVQDKQAQLLEQQLKHQDTVAAHAYLTARLNAATAMYNAIPPGNIEAETDYDLAHLLGTSRAAERKRLRQRIGFLLCEVDLYHSGKWNAYTETIAAYQYFILLLGNNYNQFNYDAVDADDTDGKDYLVSKAYRFQKLGESRRRIRGEAILASSHDYQDHNIVFVDINRIATEYDELCFAMSKMQTIDDDKIKEWHFRSLALLQRRWHEYRDKFDAGEVAQDLG